MRRYPELPESAWLADEVVSLQQNLNTANQLLYDIYRRVCHESVDAPWLPEGLMDRIQQVLIQAEMVEIQ